MAKNNFQYVLAALVVCAALVTLVMVNKKKSTRFGDRASYGRTKYGAAEEETAEATPQEVLPTPTSAGNMMPAGFNDNTGPITSNMVAKLRSAGATIQSQITHNPLKRTGGYNAVLNLREMPRAPQVGMSRNQPPVFNSSSALEDQLA